jgi:enoyl-CoA hydratase
MQAFSAKKPAVEFILMAYENLIMTEKGSTRIITINRPTVLNALNKKTLSELEQALIEIKHEGPVRAVVITGAGEKSFVAGADIGEMKNLTALEAEQFSRVGHRVFDLIGQICVPVIAAVNGYALGGGLELALACDFIYSSEHASFGLVETKLGLIPGFGGIARLARRVGDAMAREMIFSAAQINADEALRIGLVNRVVRDGEVVSCAVSVAETIAKRGPYAVSLAKSLIRDGQDSGLKIANSMEQRGFGLVFGSRDHSEGIRAFLDKRAPNFEGQ